MCMCIPPLSPSLCKQVRRDWCVLSKETGRFVIDQILSGDNRDAVVATIHTYLEELAKKMRAGEVDTRQYAITKGLNKAPHEYPDAKAQPHLQVCMLGWVRFVCVCVCVCLGGCTRSNGPPVVTCKWERERAHVSTHASPFSLPLSVCVCVNDDCRWPWR